MFITRVDYFFELKCVIYGNRDGILIGAFNGRITGAIYPLRKAQEGVGIGECNSWGWGIVLLAGVRTGRV